RAPRGRMAEAIPDEVADDLPDPDRIDVEERQLLVELGLDRYAGRVGGRGEGRRHVGDQDVEIGRLAVQRQGPGLAEGQRPEVLDQPAEDPGLLEDRPEMDLVGWMDPVEDGL